MGTKRNLIRQNVPLIACVLFYCSPSFSWEPDTTRNTWGSLSWVLPLSDWSVNKPVGHFHDRQLLWGGPSHCGWYHPWGGTNWAGVQASPEAAQHSSCLSGGLQPGNGSQTKPFLLVAFGHGVQYSNRKQNKQSYHGKEEKGDNPNLIGPR